MKHELSLFILSFLTNQKFIVMIHVHVQFTVLSIKSMDSMMISFCIKLLGFRFGTFCFGTFKNSAILHHLFRLFVRIFLLSNSKCLKLLIALFHYLLHKHWVYKNVYFFVSCSSFSIIPSDRYENVSKLDSFLFKNDISS